MNMEHVVFPLFVTRVVISCWEIRAANVLENVVYTFFCAQVQMLYLLDVFGPFGERADQRLYSGHFSKSALASLLTPILHHYYS
jgi:hypothetical protein